ncbi:glycosyltransferase [Winogradskyella aurantia]|uniref:Glycosyl transferase family 1 domain-containing protein n=1 Tax=Winogradskyella aurantia TaxID=1915063 RepID=A0A265UVB8_9FLAO|nr:glycosyltransferase [Winogradskyella aurantia]OZV69230.1 hypothetical protein CA834_07175 [Winogradskyella aurantia]
MHNYILHLIDNVSQVNYGIWNAALCNSSKLNEKGVRIYAAFPEQDGFSYPGVTPIPIKKTNEIFAWLERNKINQTNTLIVSHGCWRWPTKIGHALNKIGYRWMAVPHGMLEPWSMAQKKLKKNIYFHTIEKPLLKKADIIRAVSKPERMHLMKVFDSKVLHIPNGINPTSDSMSKPTEFPLRLLFMARLHHKKGIVPLLEGWLQSPLANNADYMLQIAGPDDGELIKMEPLIAQCSNVEYLGAVYNAQKDNLLSQSHVYVLPSYSEGFPSSVLEAMDYGLLPLISEGCNFPEAFENNCVVEVKPNAALIAETLIEISKWPIKTVIEKGRVSKDFVAKNYTNDIVTNQLYEALGRLLKR